MTYLNQHSRTTSPTKTDLMQPAGRLPALHGVFQGYIKDASDVQKNGRLRVWIPELGSDPNNEEGWSVVSYCSPFFGATNVDTISEGNTQTFAGTQTSYGMWMIPPDINNIVAIMFINGDPARGIWIGCLQNQYMNNMVPAMAASTNNYQYPGRYVPVAEYNKWDPNVSQPDQSQKPYEQTKFQGVGNQGLLKDEARGITTTSARRESPSSVFGILTPGPPTTPLQTPPPGLTPQGISDFSLTQQANIRRKGGSSFIMDDGSGSEYIQYATKTGAQIKIDETNGFVYLINRDGTAWVEMDKLGNVMIFGATNVSMRAQQDINLRADRNINIEAGQNVYIKAAKDTINSTTTFTYDVNNVPQPSTIAWYEYKGEGNGLGGNVVIQALSDIHSTATNNIYLKVGINYNLEVAQDINVSASNVNTTVSENILESANSIGITVDNGSGLMTINGSLAITETLTVGDTMSISTGTVDIIGSASITQNLDVGSSLSIGSIMSVSSGGTIDMAANVTLNGTLGITASGQLLVAGNTELNTGTGSSFQAASTGLSSPPSVPVPVIIPPTPPTVTPPTPPGSPTTPTAAEIKPLLEKINILATWADPNSKFVRKAQSLQTTVSQMPTYEPCPEHEQFTFASITGYTPTQTDGQATYEGSGGAGNPNATSPAANTDPGANNTIIPPPNPLDSALAKDFNLAAYQCQLQIHEGVKYKSYLDTKNLPTGGIGHLLRTNEIPAFTPVPVAINQDQVTAWFQNDAPTSIAGAMRLLGTDVWGNLTDIRKRACADLCYNMGEGGLSKFKTFLSNMKVGNYTLAGDSLRNSVWFTQVGRRGPNIITMITQNIDPNGCDVRFPPT
jgi:GH24 family phage-related lysozyme (muramidase)